MVNVGSLDRLLRLVLGVVLIALSIILVGLGGWQWLLAVVGAILLLTGLFRFCPAYRLLGIRTCAAG